MRRAARGRRAAGAGVLHHARERQQPRDLAGVLHEGRHHLAADADHQVDGAFEDQEHAVGRVPLAKDHLAGLESHDLAVARPATRAARRPARPAPRRDAARWQAGCSQHHLVLVTPAPVLARARASARSGCVVWWKCFVACRLGELSQQPTCPHDMHRRRWTQAAPIRRQSSHPCALGRTALDSGDVCARAVGRHQARSAWPGRCLCAISGSWLWSPRHPRPPAPRSRPDGWPPRTVRSPPDRSCTSARRRRTTARRFQVLRQRPGRCPIPRARPPRSDTASARRCAPTAPAIARPRRCDGPSPGRRRQSPPSWHGRCPPPAACAGGQNRRATPAIPPLRLRARRLD